MSAIHQMLIAAVAGPTAFLDFRDGKPVDNPGTETKFASINFGREHESRRMVALLGFSQNSIAPTADAMSIGGATASRIAQGRDTDSGGVDAFEIWIADLAAGESGEVDVTFSDPLLRAYCSVYSLIQVPSGTPSDTDTAVAPALNTMTMSLDIPAGGVALAGAYWRALNEEAPRAIWAGLTDENVDVEAINAVFSSTRGRFSAQQNGLTVSVTDGAGNISFGAAACAAWAPY